MFNGIIIVGPSWTDFGSLGKADAGGIRQATLKVSVQSETVICRHLCLRSVDRYGCLLAVDRSHDDVVHVADNGNGGARRDELVRR